MNTVRQNRDLFLTVRTGWDLGSNFYTDPKFIATWLASLDTVIENTNASYEEV